MNRQQLSMVCTLVQNSSRTPGLSLPRFEHSDIISMVGKGIDHGKLIVVDLFLKKSIDIDSGWCPFPFKFLGKS